MASVPSKPGPCSAEDFAETPLGARRASCSTASVCSDVGVLLPPCVITPRTSETTPRHSALDAYSQVLQARQSEPPPPTPTRVSRTPAARSLSKQSCPSILTTTSHQQSFSTHQPHDDFALPLPPLPLAAAHSQHVTHTQSGRAVSHHAAKGLPGQMGKGQKGGSKVDKAARGIVTLGRRASSSLASLGSSLMTSLREVKQNSFSYKADFR